MPTPFKGGGSSSSGGSSGSNNGGSQGRGGGLAAVSHTAIAARDFTFYSTEIPSSTYYYRQRLPAEEGGAEVVYKLEAILHQKQTVQVATGNIECSSLLGADLAQLQLFNDVYIPECNAASLCFIFASENDGAYTCVPTPSGALRIVSYASIAPTYDPSEAERPPEDGLDACHALSIFTIIHDFVETRTPGRYFHAGISFMPSSPLGVPTYLSAQNLRDLMAYWRRDRLPRARGQSLLSIRHFDGRTTVRHVIPQSKEKNAEGLLPTALVAVQG